MIQILDDKVRYFLSIAHEGSILRSSRELGISQPALSTSLKKFEEEIGSKLFSRNQKGVELTHKGREVYEKLVHIQTKIQDSIIPEILDKKISHLKIGCVGHIASKYFFSILKRKQKEIPTVHLYSSNSLDCFEQVQNGILDFAFIVWSNKPKKIESERITNEYLGFVGLKKKFKTIKDAKSLKELSTLPWVDLPKPQKEWPQFNPSLPAYLAREVRIVRDIILKGMAIGHIQLTFFQDDELNKLVCAKNIPPYYKDPALYVIYKKSLSLKKQKILKDLAIELKKESSLTKENLKKSGLI